MLDPAKAAVCSREQHDELLNHVRLGRLFELIEWVDDGRPTLCPDFDRPRANQSAVHEAMRIGNHSMVRFLWERCWQRPWEIERLVADAIYAGGGAACEIAKYLIRQEIPLGGVCASAVFETHDDELILMALERGLSVRSPDGFACALSCTGHSKHLLRLYRELHGKYPDLVTEGLLALRAAVEKQKVRAVALLTWAGVDPLKKIPREPYEELEASDDPDDQPDLTSALDEVRIHDKTLELIKALKVEMSEDVWLRFLEHCSWLEIERFAEVYHWVRKPDDVLTKHPDRAAEIATSILKHLEGWSFSLNSGSHQRMKLEICEYLTWLGTPMLVTDSAYEVRQIRRGFSKASDPEKVVRLLWLIHAKGDDAQQARLKEIVRTHTMQFLIRQQDPQLLCDLGLGPKSLAKNNFIKRNRPWKLESYKPPASCEKPPKKQKEPPPAPRPIYNPTPDPGPSRPGYWNRYSHFHRNS